MPSARFIGACLAQATSEQPVMLITIDHDEWEAPLRYASGGADLVSNGATYLARAFDVTPPNEGPDAGKARLVLDNIEPEAVALLRSIQLGRPRVTILVVLAAYPDDVEESWVGLSIIAMRPVGDGIECDLSTRDDGEEEWPLQSYSPQRCPGLF